MKTLVLYGAYGFTGRLITAELLKIGIRPVLAGRNDQKLSAMSAETGLSYKTVSLDDPDALRTLLMPATLVIHAAGPFSSTARPMIEACLATSTHYVDITGEYKVYEYARSLDSKALDSGVMLMPGAGFDVVPSDCLAVHLKNLLPDATSLTLAFTSRHTSPSRGTAKTMLEGATEGQKYRRDGKLLSRPLGTSVREVDFGDFTQLCTGISWGDISTAYASTGIPDIEVFTGSSKRQIRKMRWMGRFSFLLKIPLVMRYMKKQVGKMPEGPDEHKRRKGESWLWGEVSDGSVSVEARLKTPGGYVLTALTTTDIARNILDDHFKPGFQTPALVYGDSFITTVPGVSSFF